MVRFQADADLNQIIVSALLRRNSAVDFRTAANPSLKGLSDLDVLALAAAETRILVIVVPQHLPVPLVVDELLLIASATSPNDWTNRICYLPL